MIMILYCGAWAFLGFMLGLLGLSLTSLELWIIIITVLIITMLKERLYEKDLIKRLEKHNNGL